MALRKIKKMIAAVLCTVTGLGIGVAVPSGTWGVVDVQAATAYIYPTATKSSGSTSGGVTSYILAVPVMVTATHTKIKVGVSSSQDFSSDYTEYSSTSTSTEKTNISIGRWSYNSSGSNYVWVRLKYYDGSDWSGWVASRKVSY